MKKLNTNENVETEKDISNDRKNELQDTVYRGLVNWSEDDKDELAARVAGVVKK